MRIDPCSGLVIMGDKGTQEIYAAAVHLRG